MGESLHSSDSEVIGHVDGNRLSATALEATKDLLSTGSGPGHVTVKKFLALRLSEASSLHDAGVVATDGGDLTRGFRSLKVITVANGRNALGVVVHARSVTLTLHNELDVRLAAASSKRNHGGHGLVVDH